MPSSAPITARTAPEISQTASARPPVTQNSRCEPSTLRTVSSITENAAGETLGLTSGAMSVLHTESR